MTPRKPDVATTAILILSFIYIILTVLVDVGPWMWVWSACLLFAYAGVAMTCFYGRDRNNSILILLAAAVGVVGSAFESSDDQVVGILSTPLIGLVVLAQAWWSPKVVPLFLRFDQFLGRKAPPGRKNQPLPRSTAGAPGSGRWVFAWCIALSALIAGAVIVILCLPGNSWGSAKSSPLAAGIAFVVAGVSGSAALTAAQNWRQQRQLEVMAELRDQRSGVYQEVITGIINAFAEKSVSDLAGERAKVALWASPSVISAFEGWFSFAAGASGPLTLLNKPQAYQRVFDAIEAARHDLGHAGEMSIEDTMTMIFADYATDMRKAEAAAESLSSIVENIKTKDES